MLQRTRTEEIISSLGKMLKLSLFLAVAYFVIALPFAAFASTKNITPTNVENMVSNHELTSTEQTRATEIIKNVQKVTKENILQGKGPFYAEIYDAQGNFVVGGFDTVVQEQNSTNHAVMNAIKYASAYYGEYDLTKHNLSIYLSSQPCIMCIGALKLCGIHNIYYSVPSSVVQRITGFDDGFDNSFFKELKDKGMHVSGGIEQKLGEEILVFFVKTQGHKYVQNKAQDTKDVQNKSTTQTDVKEAPLKLQDQTQNSMQNSSQVSVGETATPSNEVVPHKHKDLGQDAQKADVSNKEDSIVSDLQDVLDVAVENDQETDTEQVM